MTYNIIKTDNYLLVVDDSEIKEGNYTYQESANLISKFNNAYCKKIIAHLPLNNSPILEGVPLLPRFEQEDDIYELFQEDSFDIAVDDFNTYKLGYNKAREKYKYTEEDIAKAVMFGRWGGTMKIDYENFIQSLSQPKMPVGFEFEINNPMFALTIEPKTTTNSQGQTVWVGKYIY